MVRFSDGSFAVANGGAHEIRFYSPDGSLRTKTGRQGEGPGEFTRIRGLTLTSSDTLLVLDYDGRMTVLGAGGAVARVVRLPGYVVSAHALGSAEVVVVSGSTTAGPPDFGQLVRQPYVLWRYGIGGARLDSIGLAAGYEEYMFDVEGRRGGARPLFGRDSHVATRGTTIFRGAADAMQIEELSPSGRLLRILRLAGYPLELSAGGVAAEREARLGDDPHPLVRRITDQLPNPRRRPAYAQVVVDSDAAIWLRPFLGLSERGGPEAWQVLDPDGAWLGSVAVMEGLRIMSVDRDLLMGVWIDSLGVEHPRVHRLLGRGRQPGGGGRSAQPR